MAPGALSKNRYDRCIASLGVEGFDWFMIPGKLIWPSCIFMAE